MQKYGGHALAAGFSLPAAEVDRFREEINACAQGAGDMPFPAQQLDAKLHPGRLTPDLADEIALLEPFGQGNAQPVFALQRLALTAVTPLSEGKHLRLTLEQAQARVTAMLFHTTRGDFGFWPGDVLDLAVTAEANEYMGKRSLTLVVKGVKFSRLPNEDVLAAQRLVERVQRREAMEPSQAAALLPEREDGAKIFRLLKTRPTAAFVPERLFFALIEEETRGPAGYAKLWLAAQTLTELGVLAQDGLGWYSLAPPGAKADWSSAETIVFLKGAAEHD
jgi:single-stranded-DNA-specific exonuclease